MSRGMTLRDVIVPNVLSLSIYVSGGETTEGRNDQGAKRLREEKVWGRNVSEK